jgi:hypothetical protein
MFGFIKQFRFEILGAALSLLCLATTRAYVNNKFVVWAQPKHFIHFPLPMKDDDSVASIYFCERVAKDLGGGFCEIPPQSVRPSKSYNSLGWYTANVKLKVSGVKY